MRATLAVTVGVSCWLIPYAASSQEPVTITHAGIVLSNPKTKWQALEGRVSGAAWAGGHHSARGLSPRCTGFIAIEPAVELTFEQGAPGVDIEVHADRHVQLIAYSNTDNVEYGTVSYHSTLSIAAYSSPYRLYVATPTRGVYHSYRMVISHGQSSGNVEGQPRPPSTRDTAVTLSRSLKRTYEVQKYSFTGPGRRDLLLSQWQNTYAPPQTPIPISPLTESEHRPPIMVAGQVPVVAENTPEDEECRGVSVQSHRFKVTHPGWVRIDLHAHTKRLRLRARLRRREVGEPREATVFEHVITDKDESRSWEKGEYTLEKGEYDLFLCAPPRADYISREYTAHVQMCDGGRNSCIRPPREVPKMFGGSLAEPSMPRLSGGSGAASDWLKSVVRLQVADGLCTATIIDWRGQPALLTAAHCLYRRDKRNRLRARLDQVEVAEHGTVALRGAVIATSFARCAQKRWTYARCLATGAEDLAVIPWPNAPTRLTSWRVCSRAPYAERVRALGYGLTETGLATKLMAGEVRVVRRPARSEGVWRAVGGRVLVQAGDSGGPVMPTYLYSCHADAVDDDCVKPGAAEACFVISGRQSGARAMSLLQPVWDMERRLQR